MEQPLFTKHVRPPSWLRTSDGAEWSAPVAVVRGLIIRDSEKADHLWVEGRLLSVKTLIESGTIDEACAEYVLGLPQARQAAVPAILTKRTAPRAEPYDMWSPEGQAIEALMAYLESPMSDADRARFAKALRTAVRGM